MNNCEQLDDYLAHDLAGVAEREFAHHLTECAACREAVAVERRMALALSDAIEQLEPIPGRLAVTVRRRQFIVRTRFYGAIAAAVIVVVTTLSWMNRPALDLGIDDKRVAKTEKVERPALVRVTMASDAQLTAVPVPSEHPNVSMFFLFPNSTHRVQQ